MTCKPPSNSHQIAELSNEEQSFLVLEDMSPLAKILSELMHVQEQDCCHTVHCRSERSMTVIYEVDVVKDEDVEEVEEMQSERTTVSRVETEELHYVPALRNHHSDPPVNHLQHMSVAGSPILIWQKSLPAREILDCMD